MKRSWIKLYVEILDDDKLCELPAWLKWRFVELLLVAAERDENGMLPPVKRLAWRLRLIGEKAEHELLDSLLALAKTGVVCRDGDLWKVTNFSKRQAAMTPAERVRDYRKRNVTDFETKSYKRDVTSSSSPSPSDSVSSSASFPEKEKKPPKANQIEEIVLFRRAVGMYPPRPSFETVVDSMHKIATRLKRAPGVSDLQPFLRAWTDRGYKPNNLAWLTDWAVKGAVPHQGPNGHKPVDRAGETDQERAARINAAIRSVQSDYGAEEANP